MTISHFAGDFKPGIRHCGRTMLKGTNEKQSRHATVGDAGEERRNVSKYSTICVGFVSFSTARVYPQSGCGREEEASIHTRCRDAAGIALLARFAPRHVEFAVRCPVLPQHAMNAPYGTRRASRVQRRAHPLNEPTLIAATRAPERQTGAGLRPEATPGVA